MSTPTLSVVIPVFNEEENIGALHARLAPVLDGVGLPYEVIVSDNHSTDRTPELLIQLAACDERWKYIRLSRNFGHQINVSAGLSYAQGEAVVIMDGDLQDPPELIPAFVRAWQDGYEVVYGVRESREREPFWRKFGMKLYYRLINRLSPIDLPVDAGDFRLISRKILREFLRFEESNRYLRGIFGYIGGRQIGIPYRRQGRVAGQSKFPLLRMVGLALDGITSYSMVPLRLMTFAGMAVLAAGLAYALFAVYDRLVNGAPPTGWASLAALVIGLGGTQIVFLGLIGEYVGRIYTEAKRRPLWIVEQTLNVGEDAAPRPSRSDSFLVPQAVRD